MSTSIISGPYRLEGSRTSDGNREFKVSYIIAADEDDGPYTVMNTPGLHAIGSGWDVGNDSDQWCFCRPGMQIKIHQEKEGDPTRYWSVTQEFSSKPPDPRGWSRRCDTQEITNPLLEPQGVSGGFVKMNQEAECWGDGSPLVTSALEKIKGSNVEFETSRPTVRISQNVASLELNVMCPLIDRVNSGYLWGLPPRTIRLINASWERMSYGTCMFYYQRTFEFLVDYTTKDQYGNLIGHDREVMDHGGMCINGKWCMDENSSDYGAYIINSEDNTNLANLKRYTDPTGEFAECYLNGYGLPADIDVIYNGTPYHTSMPARAILQYYEEGNFLLLGIPTYF